MTNINKKGELITVGLLVIAVAAVSLVAGMVLGLNKINLKLPVTSQVENNQGNNNGKPQIPEVRNTPEIKNKPKLSLTAVPSTIAVGQNTNVTINIDSNGNKLQVVQLTLSFDPKKLKVVDADPKAAGVQIELKNLFANQNNLANRADNDKGKITLAIGSLTNTFDGKGVYGIIKMIALQPTSSPTMISFDPDPDTLVVPQRANQAAKIEEEPLSLSISPK